MAFVNQDIIHLLSPETKAALGTIVLFEEVIKEDGEIDFVCTDQKGMHVSITNHPLSSKMKKSKK